MAFNALAYAQELEHAGVPQAQATAQAQALHRAFEEQKSELATKGDLAELRADFAELRAETRTGLIELRAELHSEVSALRQDMTQLDSKLTSQMAQSEGRMTSQIAQLETRLTRWMLIAAGVGGGIAGGLTMLSKFIP
ncbi:MAG: hypothetical protein OEU26_33900 [Candidatus Tectomicrobia bacterium]|nr:hypothetical protein [Candidatus Tectomicrobia bacterium]